MRLQADPTIRFIHKEKNILRILSKDKVIRSPYNTYLYRGLPPGPLNMPSIVSVDAVLNLKKHNYLYMAAKDDFSGGHNFSTSYRKHLLNAKRYQAKLNKHRIFR